jgi:hypothetical protein
MIVYECAHCWFALKEQAERHRIGQKLKPAATRRHEIIDRTDLARLLNAIEQTTQPEPQALPDVNIRELMEAQDEAVDTDDEADKLGIPTFLRTAS